jgi:hypothetical protein
MDSSNDEYWRLKAGAIFNLTEGDYSDYEINGTYRVLKDVDIKALYIEDSKKAGLPADVFHTYHNGKSYGGKTGYTTWTCHSVPQFIESLVNSGVIEEVDAREFHQYGFHSFIKKEK